MVGNISLLKGRFVIGWKQFTVVYYIPFGKADQPVCRDNVAETAHALLQKRAHKPPKSFSLLVFKVQTYTNSILESFRL